MAMSAQGRLASVTRLRADEEASRTWICDAVGARVWRIEYVRCIATTAVMKDDDVCEGLR